MKRAARRVAILAMALVALFAVSAVPAQASESALRERTHARIAAILIDAVGAGLYSQDQSTYVTSALLPASVDPKTLSSRVEDKTIETFWGAVTDATGLPLSQVRSRLAGGSRLTLIAGASAASLQDDLSKWLARPVVQALLEGKISAAESTSLRIDIDRAVDRLMRQPGGSDGRVAVSPRRN